MSEPRPWLLFDADDTLWENNIYFEEVIAAFITFVDHSTITRSQVREELDAIESCNTKKYGYGARIFSRNLVECYEFLKSRSCEEQEKQYIRSLITHITDHPITLIDGVSETLADLAGRHDLGLVTKGDNKEQKSKLSRSGLSEFFKYVATVPQKDVACYRKIVVEIKALPKQTWMIGNSPKSDINPALQAGIGAVWIPNSNTWSLEQEQVPEGHESLRVVRQFSKLSEMF